MGKLYVGDEKFLYHRRVFINPKILTDLGIPYEIAIQKQGEFVITNSYHFGINVGNNIAQAVNFADIDWIERGKKYEDKDKFKDTLKKNHKIFYKLFKLRQINLKIRRIHHRRYKSSR